MNTLSSREIATVVWLILFSLWALSKKDIRKASTRLLETLFNKYLLVPIVLMALYTSGVAWILHVVGVWTFDLLKVTILWFFTSALAFALNFTTWDGKKSILSAVFIDNVKGVILLEFLISKYTFPLVVELILIPVAALIVMLSTYAQREDKNSDVAKFMTGLQAFLGFIIISFAVFSAVNDFGNLRSLDTARFILLPPLLSLLLVPFVYFLGIYAAYERLFVNLKIGPKKDSSVKSYARRQLVLNLRFNLRNIRAFLHHYRRELIKVQTKAEVDSLFERWKNSD